MFVYAQHCVVIMLWLLPLVDLSVQFQSSLLRLSDLSISWHCLTAVILSNILSRSIYVCLSADLRRSKAPGGSLTHGVMYLEPAYDHTAGVPNIFPSALCGCHSYVSPV